MEFMIWTPQDGPDEYQESMRKWRRQIVDALLAENHKIYTGSAEEYTGGRIVIVLGGDGSMLQAIRDFDFSPSYIFYGINLGHHGFLMNALDKSDPLSFINLVRFIPNPYTVKFPVLHLQGETADGQTFNRLALNDVYFNRARSAMAHLQVKVDGEVWDSPMESDGLVIATALGSTSYNLSAGGPILVPPLEGITITPIAQRYPKGGVIPASCKVKVKVLSASRRPVTVTTDTEETEGIERAKISYIPDRITLGFWQLPNFIKRVNDRFRKCS